MRHYLLVKIKSDTESRQLVDDVSIKLSTLGAERMLVRALTAEEVQKLYPGHLNALARDGEKAPWTEADVQRIIDIAADAPELNGD